MEYTVQKLGRLAGISTRTLRYYDEIGILKPARINSSGYRLYGQIEVDRLQQILLYRELDIPLEQIQKILGDRFFDPKRALAEHRTTLFKKKERIEQLIRNVEKTIEMTQGGTKMSDTEKFEGFKQKTIDENEEKYGKEIREKYGETTIDQSNHKMKNMTEQQYKELQELSEEVNSTIKEAFITGDPAGEAAQKACELHKKWILLFWTRYSKEAHMALAQMYVDDPRFTVYYDKIAPGAAAFFRDAMQVYTGIKE